jgi:opacity protein-like surface antigen
MKRSRCLATILATAAVICLFAAPTAIAQPAADKGWYADLGAGINGLDQESGARRKADTGFRLCAALGHNYSKRWALELETGYLRNVVPASEDVAEKTLTQVPMLVSLTRTFPTSSFVNPWLGLGAGIVFGSYDGASGGDLALHFQAGVRHDLNARKSIGLSYRFIMMGAGSVLAAEPVGDDSLLLDFRFAL